MPLKTPPPFILLILLSTISTICAQNPCTPGTYLTAGKCQKCPPGTYQPLPATTSCIPCPKGTFNIFKGAQGLDLCEPCKPDTFNNKQGATTPAMCKKCPPGTASVSGSARCVTCEPGTYVSPFDGRPEDYVRGYNFCDRLISVRGKLVRNPGCYAGNYPRRTFCKRCLSKTFSNTTNARECTPCQDQFAPAGSTKCMGCDRPGIECIRGKSERICRNFEVNDGSVLECRRCPRGFIGNKRVGGTKCVPCPAGTFMGISKQRCSPCTGDKVVVNKGTACLDAIPNTACPSNFFRHPDGYCFQCKTWERLNVRKSKCQECPRNTVSNGGLDRKCRPCASGSIREKGDETNCYCGPGWRYNFGTCEKCPAGTSGLGRGNSCYPCRPGTFAPAGSAECRRCQFNFVAPESGLAKCSRCPRGLVPNPVRGCVSPATNCIPGARRVVDDNNILGACSVTSCPKDSFKSSGSRNGISSSFCRSCTIKERYNPTSNRCERCPSTAPFSKGGLSTECFSVNCRDGFRVHFETGECVCSGAIVDGKCVSCMSEDAPESCFPKCSVGSFLDVSRRRCILCPPNTFSDEEGLTACKPCPSGTLTGYPGSANCVVPGGLRS